MMAIRLAQRSDQAYLAQHDHHIDAVVLERKLSASEILVIERDEGVFGWLRWGYFWDEIPFMNMLYLAAAERGKGYGRQLVQGWEQRMATAGHQLVMTSTLSNEQAQYFYRKLGYIECGALLLPDEPLEILFRKPLHL